MNPLENKQTDNASLEEKQLVDQAKEKKELELENAASMNSLRDIAAAESEDSTDFHDAPTLYNDVVIDASQLDQDDEGLDFQVEEITLSPENAVPFSVNTDDCAVNQFLFLNPGTCVNPVFFRIVIVDTACYVVCQVWVFNRIYFHFKIVG